MVDVHGIDVSILNTYNILLVRKDIQPTKTKLREFVYNVAYQFLEKYGQPTTTIKGRRPNSQPDRIIKSSVFRHYPVHTQMVNGRRLRKECHVCKHTTKRPQKRTSVKIICNECNIGLCIGECFLDYHTLKNFQWIVNNFTLDICTTTSHPGLQKYCFRVCLEILESSAVTALFLISQFFCLLPSNVFHNQAVLDAYYYNCRTCHQWISSG